jgi:hypothetical protein
MTPEQFQARLQQTCTDVLLASEHRPNQLGTKDLILLVDKAVKAGARVGLDYAAEAIGSKPLATA